MTRASRIVLIATLMLTSTVIADVSPAGAAASITQVSAPTNRAACSRMSDASVRCSGQNDAGQLGDGTNTLSLNPVVVKGVGGGPSLGGIAQVVTGNFFACARTLGGQVDCWGDNTYGELGNGSHGSSAVPVTVKNSTGTGPLTGVAQIAAGKYHACARLANGTVDCWGHNGYFELGDGTNHEHLLPHTVVNGAGHGALTGQVNISITQYHSCSVQADGTARCWGLNEFGTLGDGTKKPRAIPTKVKAVSGSGFLTGVASISAAPTHTCALLKNGRMDCWGQNSLGQLGDNSVTTRTRPVPVRNVSGNAALLNVSQISAGGGSGGDHTCARLKAGTALCWGGNSFGQLGDGTKTSRRRPVIVKTTSGNGSLTKVLGIAAGPIATCAWIVGGSAKCWGFNSAGQFGNGTAHGATRPVSARP